MRSEGSGGNVAAEGIAKEEKSAPSNGGEVKDLERLQEEICKYKEKLEELQRELNESENRLRYMQADCENIRKRSERQMEEATSSADKDNVER